MTSSSSSSGTSIKAFMLRLSFPSSFLITFTVTLSPTERTAFGDLIRFWPSDGLKTIDPNDYSYVKGLQKAKAIEKKLGDKSTSIFSKNGDKSTKNLWKTETFKELHPELDTEKSSEASNSSSKK